MCVAKFLLYSKKSITRLPPMLPSFFLVLGGDPKAGGSCAWMKLIVQSFNDMYSYDCSTVHTLFAKRSAVTMDIWRNGMDTGEFNEGLVSTNLHVSDSS